MEAILDGLPQPIKLKTRQCISAKELWVKLEKLYSVEQRVEESLDIFENDSEEPCSHKEDQRSKTIYKKKFNKKKENLYSMEDSEDEENLFMGTITSEDDSYMEGEVDQKAEHISTLE